jgi:hypothetical protein
LDVDAAEFLAGFGRVCAAAQIDVVLGAQETMRDVHQDQFLFAPVRTGRMRRSLYHRVRAFARQVVGAAGTEGVGYAAAVEFGSQPHLIEPVRAEALRWQGPGGSVFARRVRHPGTAPRPFFRGGWARAPRHFERRMRSRFGGGG